MNALVKKEIRLMLPSWAVAVLLVLTSAFPQPTYYLPFVVLFVGLIMMALTSIGREASLNTFSSLLAQPVNRTRIWQVKLSVLAVGFLTVFIIWRLSIGILFGDFSLILADFDKNDCAVLFVAGCLVVVSTFTGGLWATLLLRQIAGAFWLAFLVPALVTGFTVAFLAENNSSNNVAVVLCVVLGIYSLGGFLFARWLFFRAQDVGWTGGILALPEWKISATRSNAANSARTRKPIFALLKKEFQLQQVSLMGAAALLVLHIGVIVLRTNHKFHKDSAGEVLTSIFWMLWLVLPVMVGAMAVAEERRLGMMEGQLCLPVSRRVQFVIKALLTLFLGTLLGGVLPCLLEAFGTSSVLWEPNASAPIFILLAIVSLAVWLALVGFFASSLARNFLQAIGYAIGTCIGIVLVISAFAEGRPYFYESLPTGSILPLVIGVPTLPVMLLLLAYLNFKNFVNDWRLWRRNLLFFGGALLFIMTSSMAIHNRIWEVFQPAEPAHGAAKLSLANPPNLQVAQYNELLVRLPDGRVWFDGLVGGDYDGISQWKYVWQKLTHPLPESIGPKQFLAGSNWVAATTEHMGYRWFMETVGIQPDGTLWLSDRPAENKWEPGKLHQFGSETNWRQLAQGRRNVILLKGDGTLWSWGSITNHWNPSAGPRLTAFTPYQIGTNSDWQELFANGWIFARQADGRVWRLSEDWKAWRYELNRETNYDEVNLQTASIAGELATAFVRADGTLWGLNRYWDEQSQQIKGTEIFIKGTGILQVGKETDWRAVAVNHGMMVALKADGSLWQWNFEQGSVVRAINYSPKRLGIHNDWVAITSNWESVIALAADGSLWLWPDRGYYDYESLLKLPKQPQLLGNIFGHAD